MLRINFNIVIKKHRLFEKIIFSSILCIFNVFSSAELHKDIIFEADYGTRENEFKRTHFHTPSEMENVPHAFLFKSDTLIISDDHNKRIKYLNANTGKLFKKINLPSGLINLYKDCFGNLIKVAPGFSWVYKDSTGISMVEYGVNEISHSHMRSFNKIDSAQIIISKGDIYIYSTKNIGD